MAEILQSPQHFPSSSSSTILVSPLDNDGLHQQQLHQNIDAFIRIPDTFPVDLYRGDTEIHQEGEEGFGEGGVRRERKKRVREEGDQLSLLTVLVTVFRKSLVACKSEVGGVEEKISSSMEISWPTNVRHVSHVTFDRFNGFLGLPVEFEPEVPRRPPSASTRVFGVSTVSMQLSFDTRGNSVPTILLMMQRRLYSQGGLQAEGIFRINAENGQEEYIREQLNRGVVPDDVDVHCLAGLIKAWFRELPTALLDCLPPEQVMQAQSEEECCQLVRNLPPTEAALLDWAINLMADVAQLEHHNKMNARNISMVFAPNMTQMADPLTALMFAVQVMNFLKTLIEKTLRDREDSTVEIDQSHSRLEPSDENGDHGASLQITYGEDKENEEDQLRAAKELHSCPASNLNQDLYSISDRFETVAQDEKENLVTHCPLEDSKHSNLCKDALEDRDNAKSVGRYQSKSRRTKSGQSSDSSAKRTPRKLIVRPMINVEGNAEKEKETSIISRINTQAERVEAWR